MCFHSLHLLRPENLHFGGDSLVSLYFANAVGCIARHAFGCNGVMCFVSPKHDVASLLLCFQSFASICFMLPNDEVSPLMYVCDHAKHKLSVILAGVCP